MLTCKNILNVDVIFFPFKSPHFHIFMVIIVLTLNKIGERTHCLIPVLNYINPNLHNFRVSIVIHNTKYTELKEFIRISL
jgi:hypothetical protein